MRRKHFFNTIINYNFIIIIVILSSPYVQAYTNIKNDVHYFLDVSATISVNKPEVCQNESALITFTGSGGIAPYTFTYTINGGTDQIITTINTENSISIPVSTNVSGNFTYELTNVEDSSGDSQVISGQSEIIIVNPLPTVNFTFTNDNSCAGTEIEFSSTASGTGTLEYTWNFGDSTSSAVSNPTHSYSSNGCGDETFHVTLTVTDANNCSTTIAKDITVKRVPEFVIYDTSGKDFSNCGNSTSSDPSYTVEIGELSSSSCILNYSINWGDGNTDSNISFPISHTYASLGVYNMVINANSDNGCSIEEIVQIKNISNPAGSLVNPGTTQNLCAPTAQIEFSISTWANNSIDTFYEVDYGDGTIVTLTQNDLINSIYYNASDPSNSQDYLVPHSYLVTSCPTGTYTASLNIVNACGSTQSQLPNISVLESPILDIVAPEISCVNTSVEFINNSTYGFKDNCQNSGILTWDFGDGTAPVVTTTLDNQNHTYIIPGNYTIRITAVSFCGTVELEKTICIEPPLIPQFIPSETKGCAPLNITINNITNLTSICSTPTYMWSVTYTAANCGTSANWGFINGTDQNFKNPEFNFGTSGTYTLTLTTTNSCGVFTTSQDIEVKEPPKVAIESITDYCGPTSISPVAVIENCTPNISSLSYNWTFIGGSPTTSTIINPTGINYTTPGVYTITLEATNECGVSTKATESFEILPIPTITNTDFEQIICSALPTTAIILTSDIIGTTYNWVASATAGLSGFISSGSTNSIPIQTITNANASQGVVTYTITPLLGTCIGLPFEYQIKVNPSPIITTQPQSETVCEGGIPTQLTVTYGNGTGSPTYQWFENTTNSNVGGTLIAGETNVTYQPDGTTVGTRYYYVEITFPTGGCSNLVSDTATIIVTSGITIDTPRPLEIICEGGSASTMDVTYTGGTGAATYQWYENTTNSNTGGTLISGETNASYTSPAYITVGMYYYYVEVSLNGNGCGAMNSGVYEVQVVADPIIDTQAIITQELCQGTAPQNLEVIVSSGVGVTYNYQWYSNTTNNNTLGAAITGATNAIYTPLTTTAGTSYYYVEVSQTASGCSVVSATSEVIVNLAPIITTQPQSETVCEGGIPTQLTVTYGNGTGSPTYQWFENTTNSNIGGTLISGETNATYQPAATTAGTRYYYVEITFPTGGCSNLVSDAATIIVTPGITIDTPRPTEIICEGGSASTMDVTYTGGTGTASYQWYENTTNTNTGGTLISGETSSSYTPPVYSLPETFYYYVEVNLSGNGCGAVNSAVYKVQVVADPIIDTQAITTQELCEESTPIDLEVVMSSGVGLIYNYQWFESTLNNTTSGTLITGATSSIYTPPTLTVGILYYYVEVSQIAPGCSVVSATSEVIVNLAPIITTQPQSETVCEGATPALLTVTYSNGVGTPTYQWYENSTNTNVGGTLISGETNATYQPAGTSVGTRYYYVEITFPTGGCSNLVSDTATIIINPVIQINSSNITICSGATFLLEPATIIGNNVPIGTTYTWTTPIVSPINSITGSSEELTPKNNISQTLVNITTNPSLVTYTVTPISGICTGADFKIEVTVDPSINPNVVVTNNDCFDANNASIETNITGGIPFSTGNPYQISWTGPNGFTSSDPNIYNLIPGIYNLNINDQGGCPFTNDYTITQPNELEIATDIEKNISCFNGLDGSIAITISGGTLPYNYNWTTSDGSGLAFDVEDQTGLTAGTYNLEVIDGNNCKISNTYVLTEPDQITINVISKMNILCSGDTTGAIEVAINGGTPKEVSTGVFEYQYNWSGTDGFTSNSQNISNISAGIYTLIVTDDLSCTKQIEIEITEPNEILIGITKTDVTCYKANDGSIQLSIRGGKEPYSISWSNLGTGVLQNNLSADTYTVTVEDQNNCTKTEVIQLNQPIFYTSPIVTQISCFGKNDGSIDLNLVGGITPVTVAWLDDSSAGIQRNNLSAGTYTVLITDSDTYQCPIQESFIIIEPLELLLNATIKDATDCTIINSGNIDLQIVGGTAPYSYNWSNGFTTEDLTNVPPGNYLVNVTDKHGCSISEQYKVSRQDPLKAILTSDITTNCEVKEVTQKIIAKASGGFPPYSYSWSGGTVSGINNEIMTTDQSGTYSVQVADSNGCIYNENFTISLPEIIAEPSFNYSSFGIEEYHTISIQDPIQFTNNSLGNYISISWDFGDGSLIVYEENPVHTYTYEASFVVTQTIEYDFGCSYSFSRTLNTTKGYELINPNGFTPNNDGINETIRPSFKGMKDLEMSIYDTWGTLIYYEKGLQLKGWDGNINEKPAENGNYVMVVKAITFYNKEVLINSPITLLK